MSTDCVYVFRNIMYDENAFAFASLHSNASARMRTKIRLLSSHHVEPFSFDHDGVCTVDTSVPTGSSNNLVQESFDQEFQVQNDDQSGELGRQVHKSYLPRAA
jgi:hypothetical protein